MSKDNFSPKLQRLIGQIRFRPTLLSYQEVLATARELEGKFEEWRADNNNSIILYSPLHRKYMQIASDVITCVNESGDNFDEFREYLKKIFERSVKTCSISQVRRIGVRNTRVLESTFEFRELTDLIYRKFYSQPKKIKHISGNELKEVVFVLDSSKNEFLNHTQIGPVKKVEALKYFQSSFEVEKELPTDNNIFIDVDVFLTEGLKPANTLKKLNEAIQENQRIMNEYINYLKAK